GDLCAVDVSADDDRARHRRQREGARSDSPGTGGGHPPDRPAAGAGLLPETRAGSDQPGDPSHPDHHRSDRPVARGGRGSSGMTTVLALQAPSVEYAQLSPMLIVIGVAVAGVLVEAFL